MKALYRSIMIWLLLFTILQLHAEYFIYLNSMWLQQPWRLLTAHWVHVGWAHYALNMAALLCLPLIFPHFKTCWLWLIIFILPVLLSLVFRGFYPEIYAYAGFSAVLHGLYTAAAITCMQLPRERKFGMVILLGIALKLTWEAIQGSSSMTEAWIGSPVMVEAHAWGVFLVIGLTFFSWLMLQFKVNWHNR